MDKFLVRQTQANKSRADDDRRNIILQNNIFSANDLESINPVSLPAIFQEWMEQYSWLKPNSENKAICSTCTEACNKNIMIKFDGRSLNSKKAWVDEGFSNWKHGAERIKAHSKSTLHVNCAEALNQLSSVTVAQQISSAHLKQTMDNRTALLKIFSTLLALAKQGLSMRGGNNDESSNFISILKARAEDVPQLRFWLQKEGNKWLHHTIQNEILELMATHVLSQLMDEIRQAEYFSILLDETSDISQTEQVSICIRIVSTDLIAKEYFIGFFSTPDTKSKTLFDLVNTILLKFNLPLTKLRGQCYDGAANVSGKISGLQKRICEIEPRALFVHCNAHNLNIVVQDCLEKVLLARKFIGTMKDLINFVKDSRKRCAQFKEFQSHSDINLPSLSAYCPTRWIVRIKSLRAVRANYSELQQFFYDRSVDREIDSSAAAKALGFFDYMASFECIFLLNTMIDIFDRIEILNTELQSSDCSVIESHEKIKAVASVLHKSRNTKFDAIWQKRVKDADALDLDEPKIPRLRKLPKRIDPGNIEYSQFKTPEDFYRKQYLEVFDKLLMSLKSRFENDSAIFLELLERFSVGDSGDLDTIINFYKDFDKERLMSDKQMFIELLKRQSEEVNSFKEVVEFLKKFAWCAGLIPEFVRLVRLLMTIPGSSCSNERSFSVLRRLKSYLRATMSQNRLNDIAILHVYSDKSEKLDLNILLNEFITKCSKRRAVFALSK